MTVSAHCIRQQQSSIHHRAKVLLNPSDLTAVAPSLRASTRSLMTLSGKALALTLSTVHPVQTTVPRNKSSTMIAMIFMTIMKVTTRITLGQVLTCYDF